MAPSFFFLIFVLQVCLRHRRAAAALRMDVMPLFSEASVLTRHLLGGGIGERVKRERGIFQDYAPLV